MENIHDTLFYVRLVLSLVSLVCACISLICMYISYKALKSISKSTSTLLDNMEKNQSFLSKLKNKLDNLIYRKGKTE